MRTDVGVALMIPNTLDEVTDAFSLLLRHTSIPVKFTGIMGGGEIESDFVGVDAVTDEGAVIGSRRDDRVCLTRCCAEAVFCI